MSTITPGRDDSAKAGFIPPKASSSGKPSKTPTDEQMVSRIEQLEKMMTAENEKILSTIIEIDLQKTANLSRIEEGSILPVLAHAIEEIREQTESFSKGEPERFSSTDYRLLAGCSTSFIDSLRFGLRVSRASAQVQEAELTALETQIEELSQQLHQVASTSQVASASNSKTPSIKVLSSLHELQMIYGNLDATESTESPLALINSMVTSNGKIGLNAAGKPELIPPQAKAATNQEATVDAKIAFCKLLNTALNLPDKTLLQSLLATPWAQNVMEAHPDLSQLKDLPELKRYFPGTSFKEFVAEYEQTKAEMSGLIGRTIEREQPVYEGKSRKQILLAETAQSEAEDEIIRLRKRIKTTTGTDDTKRSVDEAHIGEEREKIAKARVALAQNKADLKNAKVLVLHNLKREWGALLDKMQEKKENKIEKRIEKIQALVEKKELTIEEAHKEATKAFLIPPPYTSVAMTIALKRQIFDDLIAEMILADTRLPTQKNRELRSKTNVVLTASSMEQWYHKQMLESSQLMNEKLDEWQTL